MLINMTYINHLPIIAMMTRTLRGGGKLTDSELYDIDNNSCFFKGYEKCLYNDYAGMCRLPPPPPLHTVTVFLKKCCTLTPFGIIKLTYLCNSVQICLLKVISMNKLHKLIKSCLTNVEQKCESTRLLSWLWLQRV